MKRFFSIPILLPVSACPGIELDPFRGGYELPGGPVPGLRDIDYDCGPGLGGALVHYEDGELESHDPSTDGNLHDPAPVNANVGRAAAQSILSEYR